MSCFSKIFVLSFFCMCALNCSAYCMESGGEVAPEAANSAVAESLPTPSEEKSESKENSAPGVTESNNESKPSDKTKSGDEADNKVKSDEETEASEEEKSEENSSNVVGKVTVDVKERESSMDYYIIYDEDGNIVGIKDAKDASDDSDDSDERCKERVRSYSYSQEIIYYRS